MKETPEQIISKCVNNIVREIASWKYMQEHGCNDPFWSDGCNMNLREILFKAKRKDNGEWVEGQYVYITNPLTEDGKPIKHLICNGTNIFNDLIDPDTLCQYTGLTDKNGKKIWENDILRGLGNDKDLSKVSFGKFYVIDAETLRRVDEVIGWHTEVIETDALSKCEPFCLPMPLTDFYIERSEFEVYGNIFDNPELLEVEK